MTNEELKRLKEDIWLVINTAISLGLHHHVDTEKIAATVIEMIGKKHLSEFFGIERHLVSDRLASYIYNHEF